MTMRTQFPGLCGLLLLVGLLAGCGSSPPTHYYLLTAQETEHPQGLAPSIGVGPIEIPAYLDRNGLVYYRQGNQLQVAGNHLWAEPLAAGIERVLAINLAGILNTQNVHTFPWHPKRAPDYGVRVQLLALDAGADEAVLTAEWLVYDTAQATTVEQRISRITRTLPAGLADPAQVPATYSELFYELSQIIAAAITARDDQATGAETAP